jgi:hypothetical protein
MQLLRRSLGETCCRQPKRKRKIYPSKNVKNWHENWLGRKEKRKHRKTAAVTPSLETKGRPQKSDKSRKAKMVGMKIWRTVQRSLQIKEILSSD